MGEVSQADYQLSTRGGWIGLGIALYVLMIYGIGAFVPLPFWMVPGEAVLMLLVLCLGPRIIGSDRRYVTALFALQRPRRVLVAWPLIVMMFYWATTLVIQSSHPDFSRVPWLPLLISLGAVAIMEELIFRGALYGAFAAISGRPWVAIVGTSLLFGLVHLTHWGEWGEAFTLANCVSVMAAGYLFAVLRYRTGSILLSIIAHLCMDIPGRVFLMGVRDKPQALGHIGAGIWVEALFMLLVGTLVLLNGKSLRRSGKGEKACAARDSR